MSHRRKVLAVRLHVAAAYLPFAAPGRHRAGQRVPDPHQEQEEWLTAEQTLDDQRLEQLAPGEQLSFA
jgi:hypothetical protein